jgi:hypothetical protein
MHESTAGRLQEALAELTRSSAARHRLPRESPECQAAIAEEMLLVEEVRALIDAVRLEPPA